MVIYTKIIPANCFAGIIICAVLFKSRDGDYCALIGCYGECNGVAVVDKDDVLKVCRLDRIVAYRGVELDVINALAADDIYVFLGGTRLQRLVNRRVYVASRQLRHAAAHHHVASVWQCSFGKRLKGLATHHYGVARGEELEALLIVRQPIQQFVFLSDYAFVDYVK